MREDAWLGERLGRRAFTIEDGDDLAGGGPGFYQARVDCGAVARVSALEAAGFRVVDVNVTLRREGGPLDGSPGVDVALASAEQREAVLEIAAGHYDVSRFHMDPAVPDADAATIKRDWAAALLDGGRGDGMLVATVRDRVVGFLGMLGRTIDLVAVRADARGAGVGRALVARMAESGEPIDVGTQVANTGALRFYERLGFVTVSTRYVLHRHVA